MQAGEQLSGRSLIQQWLDLIVISLLIPVTGMFVFLPPLNGTPLRPLFAIGFVLFVPGYVVVAAVFPRLGRVGVEGRTGTSTGGQSNHRDLDIVDRTVLSFGVSVSLVILTGLALGLNPGGLTTATLFAVLATVTAGGSIIAAGRRWQLPATQRGSGPIRRGLAGASSTLFGNRTGVETVLNIALVLSLLLAVLAVGGGFNQDAGVTEFYLLVDDTDGSATDYPAELTRGESKEFILGITNQESETVEYTVIIQLQELESSGESRSVVAINELDRFTETLSHNESREISHSITPERSGENHRLVYLLYKDEVPPNPQIGNAYREVHIGVAIE